MPVKRVEDLKDKTGREAGQMWQKRSQGEQFDY